MQNSSKKGSLEAKFQDFGSAPSDGLWGNISEALEEDDSRKGVYWWWLTGGIAALLIVALVIFNQNETPYSNIPNVIIVDQNEEVGSSVSKTITNKNELKIDDEKGKNVKIENSLLIIKYDKKVIINDKEQFDKKQLLVGENKTTQEENNVEQTDIVQVESVIAKQGLPEIFNSHLVDRKDMSLMDIPNVSLLNLQTELPVLPASIVLPKPINNRPWEYGVSLAYWTNYQFSNPQNSLTTSTMAFQADNFTVNQSGAPLENLYGSTPLISSGWSQKNLNVNFFVGKYWSNRIGWRSGLEISRTTFYTNYFQSDLVDAETAITSIGIPVALKYDMIKRNKFKLNAKFGLVNELPMFESNKTNYSNFNSSKQNKFRIGYMLAIECSLGFEFKISNNLAIGINPGFKYYITQNIRSQNVLLKEDNWVGGIIGLIWGF